MKKLVGILVVGVVVVIGLVAINKAMTPKTTLNGKMKVSASFYPIFFLVSQIGGEKIDAINITPPGIEPHDYELTTGNQKDLADSKIIFANGGIEPWAEKIDNIKYVGKDLMTDNDPHVWMDPLKYQRMTVVVTDELITLDPVNEIYYRDNADLLIKRIEELDTEMRNWLAVCNQRTIVTSHAAFGHLAKRYNLTQEEISGLSPEEEPTTKRLAEVAQMVTDKKIKYIFFETLVTPDLAETIAQETGAMTLVLNPLEGLTTEEMNTGSDYFSVQMKNLANLKVALECK